MASKVIYSATDAAPPVLLNYTDDIVLTNVHIILAVQTSANTIQTIRADSMNQKEIFIPYPIFNSVNLTGTVQTLTNRIYTEFPNATLLKIYYMTFLADAAGNNNNSHNNLNSKFEKIDFSVNGNIIANIDQHTASDIDKFINEKFPRSVLSGYFEILDTPVFCYIFRSDEKKEIHEEFNQLKKQGLEFGGNDIQISMVLQKNNNTALDHFLYSVIMRAFYTKDGVFSVVPFA